VSDEDRADGVHLPFVGLQPFTDGERDYFFGRERDERIIASNLHAAALTVLYGATGAGKSSVLLAGVVPRLRAEARLAVVAFRDWQRRDFLTDLKAECVRAAGAALGEPPEGLDVTSPLDELLLEISACVGGPVFVILDQFEEYFANHPIQNGEEPFEPELARVVNRSDLDAGVLIALREDALPDMDRFRPRIPGLLANTIRLHHLSPAAAERAIREPLDVYAARTGESVGVEDELVAELLEQVRVRHGQSPLARRDAGRGGGEPPTDEVATPLLQLVLEHMWLDRQRSNAPTLTLKRFRDLGGAEGIVGQHFEQVIKPLSPDQKNLCARFFDRLVTPSGGKIAYPIDALERHAGAQAGLVEPTLKLLTEARILRRVELTDGPAVEIFHDVLAPKILEWQQAFTQQRLVTERRRKKTKRLVALGVLLTLAASVFAYFYVDWRNSRPWGTLTNQQTGEAFRLSGDGVRVGRNAGDISNDINVEVQHYVSRIHFWLFRDLRAIDMRSLYGTTVNARFLRYGESRPLRPGDIVVLAGAVPFTFKRLHYSPVPFLTPSADDQPPTRGWGSLVDGTSRSVTPLRRARYFLAVREKRIAVLPARTPDALAWIDRRGPGEVYVHGVRDSAPLSVEQKLGDYEYARGDLRDGGSHLNYVAEAGRRVPGNLVWSVQKMPFQIVEFVPSP
jgi:FHA domain